MKCEGMDSKVAFSEKWHGEIYNTVEDLIRDSYVSARIEKSWW